MNRDDDFIGRLEDYLELFDGVTPLPDRVRDAIHAELPRTRQARPVAGMGRMLDMITRASIPARIAMGVAAVVAVFVLGAAVFSNGRAGPRVGAAPTTASPSTASSPAPAAPTSSAPTSLSTATRVTCESGPPAECLAPGTYRLSSSKWPAQITVDVPAGWVPWMPAADFEGLLVDSGQNNGSGWGAAFIAVGAVSADPCDPSKGTLDLASTSTVDGLVSAMRGWPGFDVSAPAPITVSGFSGQQVELTVSTSWKGCANPVLWTTPNRWPVNAYPLTNNSVTTTRPAQFRILDVDGTVLVIRTTDFPGTSPNELAQGIADDPTRHAADQVELHQILDSIKVTTTSQ